MKNWIAKMWAEFRKEESGQDLIEYALLAALLSIVSIVALQALGPVISGVWGQIQTAIAGA